LIEPFLAGTNSIPLPLLHGIFIFNILGVFLIQHAELHRQSFFLALLLAALVICNAPLLSADGGEGDGKCAGEGQCSCPNCGGILL
jgi:hypothetical protein